MTKLAMATALAILVTPVLAHHGTNASYDLTKQVTLTGTVTFLYEYMHFFRVVPTDGRAHSSDVDPTFMGESVGKWDGDTLVVDTIGLKPWPIDAYTTGVVRYHSDALHVIERYRHIDPTTVSLEMTIDDPKIFTRPWSQNFQMKLHPTWKLFEQICEENNRCEAGSCKPADVQQKAK